MTDQPKRVAVVAPGMLPDERARFGVGVDAVIESSMVPRGMGYILDPEQVMLTDLETGVRSWPIRDLLDGCSAERPGE